MDESKTERAQTNDLGTNHGTNELKRMSPQENSEAIHFAVKGKRSNAQGVLNHQKRMQRVKALSEFQNLSVVRTTTQIGKRISQRKAMVGVVRKDSTTGEGRPVVHLQWQHDHEYLHLFYSNE